jgi:hypothetical protein
MLADRNDGKWTPITLDELCVLIDEAVSRLDDDHIRFWDSIRIDPMKWMQHPWGELGGGFWVVALIGSTAIWYNDIEDGFNTSKFCHAGKLDEYWCDDLELNHVVHQVRRSIVDAAPLPARRGPSRPMVDE